MEVHGDELDDAVDRADVGARAQRGVGRVGVDAQSGSPFAAVERAATTAQLLAGAVNE
jgi:hypothetical protein